MQFNRTILDAGLILLLVFSISRPVQSQNLAKWPLDNANQDHAVNVQTGLSATVLQRGNGVSGLQFNANGGGARGWSLGDEKSSQDYLEVCLIPNAGRTVDITGLEFSESRTGVGPRAFEIWYSSDGFVTATRLDSIAVPDDPHERTHTLTSLPASGCNADQLCFRWYAYASESGNGFWYLKNVRLLGSVTAACTPPPLAGSLSAVNIGLNSLDLHLGSGLGDGCLVVMQKGQAVSGKPCNGEIYTGDPVFGDGSALNGSAFVVYAGPWNTTIPVENLEEGAHYYCTLFPYNSTDYCYNLAGPSLLDVFMQCLHPGDVKDTLSFASDGKLSLSWTTPDCFDQILAVVSTHPITGVPSGNGGQYAANPVFGMGSDPSGDFPGDEFPAYLGSGGTVTITGLDNETKYFVKIFARRNFNWSPGIELDAVPFDGCPDLGGHDVVFINEIHYENNGEDVDEGVEIAGPANFSLDGYELLFYETISPSQGQLYLVLPLYDRIDNEGNGYGALWFPVPGMADGSGGIALYNTITQTVVQFLGYRNAFTAIDGAAAGMTSTLIVQSNGSGAFESAAFEAGTSLQLEGEGACPQDLNWNMMVPMSIGTLNANQTVLPITLIAFDARLAEGKKVLVTWSTASEHNNDFMAVERSTDGRAFEEIGRVKGAGESDRILAYSLRDESPAAGMNYYRLRQVDFDGQYSYSPVSGVYVPAGSGELMLAPNPATAELNISGLEVTEGARVEVFNADGQEIAGSWKNKLTSFERLDIGPLAPGLYFVRLADEKGRLYTGRFIKVSGQ